MSVVLWQLSSDEFVNDGAIALGRKLAEATDSRGEPLPVRIKKDQIVLDIEGSTAAPETFEAVHETLFSLIREAFGKTHQRSAIAYQINQGLKDRGYGPGDVPWVPAPDRPFPTNDSRTFVPFYPEAIGPGGLTQYDDDRVTVEAFASTGDDGNDDAEVEAEDRTESPALIPFSSAEVSINPGDSRALYKERSTFSGNPNTMNMERLAPEIATYLRVFVDTLAEHASAGDASEAEVGDGPADQCQACGSSVMPIGKVEGEDWDGKVRYNQSSTPWVANDGSPQPLGQSSATSSHNGRCVACVLGGFYHGLRPKPVFEIDPSEQTKRVLVPVGDFERLDAVHALLDGRMRAEDSMDPEVDLRATVGTVRTDSAGFQVFGYFDAMLREYSERVGSGPRNIAVGERLPTAVRTYIAERNPSGGRAISSFEQVDPGAWGYEIVEYQHPESDRAEDYWPMDPLRWYATVDLSGETTLEHRKNQLAYGLLNRDSGEVVTAIAEIYKRTVADDDPFMQRFEAPGLHHYIDTMLNHMLSGQNGEQLDDETRESLYRLGGTIGDAFSGPQGIGTLTRLQNASTQSAFEEALSRVGEALHKRRLEIEAKKRDADDPSEVDDFWSDYKDDDIDRVFDALLTRDWRSVQQLLVAHAFLSAQADYSYSRWKASSNDSDSPNGESSGGGADAALTEDD